MDVRLDRPLRRRHAGPDLAEAACNARIREAILDSAETGRWIERPEEPR